MRIPRLLVLTAVVPVITALAVVAGSGPAAAGSMDMSQSNNWSGYNVGALNGGTFTPVTSVSATWTVPTASAHKANEAENSAMWVGIGGGCVDSGCSLADSTLIQAGTEQDVNADGTTSYSAWWETIPAPSVDSGLTIRPGDQMKVSIVQGALAEVWTITITDVTTGKTANATVNPTAYTSDYSTAEYILETPVTAGSSGAGIGVMPDLRSPAFDLATLNGKSAALNSSEAIQLVDGSGNVEATPSAPDPDGDGFSVCTWASTCGAPASS